MYNTFSNITLYFEKKVKYHIKKLSSCPETVQCSLLFRNVIRHKEATKSALQIISVQIYTFSSCILLFSYFDHQ